MEKLIHRPDGALVIDDPSLVVGSRFKIVGRNPAYAEYKKSLWIVTEKCVEEIKKWRAAHPTYIGDQAQLYVAREGRLTYPMRFWSKSMEYVPE